MPEKKRAYKQAVIKVGLADDHTLFRTGLISLLKEQEDMRVVLEASGGKQLLGQLKKITPHIVLMDVKMPEMSGIEAFELMKKDYPGVKVLFLSMYADDDLMLEILNKGANGFVCKEKSLATLVDAIYCVIDKGLYISPEVKEALRRRREANVQGSENEQELALSERETHMLKLICQQKTSGEIAAILGLSERTVHAHRKRIQLKTKSRNVAGLVLYAVKHNILTENEIFTTL